MKTHCLLILIFIHSLTFAQKYEEFRPKSAMAPPVSLQSGVTVELLKTINDNAVRVVYRPQNNSLYYNSQEGNVYQIELTAEGNPISETLITSAAEHNINRMQGMTLVDNSLILVGNYNDDVNKLGYGIVKKCTFQPNGSLTLTTMLTTEIYASSGTLFDHAFSAIAVNPTKDSVYIASGSRTDHGEVKSLNGLYPNLREQPITTKIYRIPLNASGIILQNNETALTNSGYVFARGVRNEFDMAFNGQNRLFGVENSGERDDPEEMNWLRQGKHYGFPWRMGGNDTPQQYGGYNPSNDLLIPANSNVSSFYNDPSYPPRPTNVTFTEPIINLGPDANWVRNPTTGAMYQSNTISTFTGHRSPVGLVFDTDSTLQMPYTGNGFVLAHSTGGGSAGYLDPIDEGGDLCHLQLVYDSSIDNYKVSVTKLVKGFYWATDAEKVQNVIYVTEYFNKIWKITLPKLNPPIANFNVSQQPCLSKPIFANISQNPPLSFTWDFGDGSFSNQANPTHEYNTTGTFNVQLTARNPQGVHTYQATLSVPNTFNITNPISSSTVFEGANKINGNNIVSGTNNITKYRAKQSVLLDTGFKVENIKSFSAEIGGCEN
ncbi:MAG: PKD domain-containing protein [Spirosomataceae bacterium]